MSAPSFRRAPHVVFDVSDGRATLLNDAGTHLVTLNEIGTTLWLEFDEPRSAEHLVGALESAYPDVPREQLASDCARFLDELAANGLLDAVD